MITTDHQRADSLSMVQAGREVCPRLNGLAQQSTLFSRAYTTCPLCVPARTALATGCFPTRTGVEINLTPTRADTSFVTMHEHLAAAGYTMGHVGMNHVAVAPELSERVQWHTWIDHNNHARLLESHDVPPFGERFRRPVQLDEGGQTQQRAYSNTEVGRWDYDVELFRDIYFADQAAQFLQQVGGEPFALFLNLWAPHPPLVLPEPYDQLFDPALVTLPENINQPAAGEPASWRQGVAAQLADGIDEAQWRRVWAAHLGLVALADAMIGRVLDALVDLGCDDDTMVVFCSDHGDHLGQHTMYQKMEMYEQAIRVPMLVRLAGQSALQTVHTPVSHLDLLPTMMDVLNLPGGRPQDGISLRGALEGGAAPQRRAVYSQYSGNAGRGSVRRAVITEQYKYVHTPDDEPALFDLSNDPLETQNIANATAQQQVREALRADLQVACHRHQDWASL